MGVFIFILCVSSFDGGTLPETNSSPLKVDGWNTIVSFWETLFSGAFAVSFPGAWMSQEITKWLVSGL